jgi:hypothetical protein
MPPTHKHCSAIWHGITGASKLAWLSLPHAFCSQGHGEDGFSLPEDVIFQRTDGSPEPITRLVLWILGSLFNGSWSQFTVDRSIPADPSHAFTEGTRLVLQWVCKTGGNGAEWWSGLLLSRTPPTHPHAGCFLYVVMCEEQCRQLATWAWIMVGLGSGGNSVSPVFVLVDKNKSSPSC